MVIITIKNTFLLHLILTIEKSILTPHQNTTIMIMLSVILNLIIGDSFI